MAKFKVGDVVFAGWGKRKFEIVQVNPDYGNGQTYAVKPVDGGAVTAEREENIKTAANSVPLSSNPVVQNALNRCRNEAVATNYNPFFVGDVVTYSDTPGKRFKVRKCGTDWCKINEIDGSGKYVKSEYGLDYDAYVVPVGRIHKINNSALNSAAVADAGRVKVVCETETLFGTRREEKTMTVAELRAAFAKVGSSRLFNDVMNDFSAGRDANPLLRLPCETWITRP